jgi:predicted nuclease of predicted toxin-antitoxin system
MKRERQPYVKQKFRLYLDANFPRNIVKVLETSSNWRRKCKIYSASDLGFEKKDDLFHFGYCRKNKLVLVTLDKDFMDDSKYPFSEIPGIIRIAGKKNDAVTILTNLRQLLDFLSLFSFPRSFIGDTKFEVTSSGCLIRGRDAVTREIKSVTIRPGDSVSKVRKAFGYF